MGGVWCGGEGGGVGRGVELPEFVRGRDEGVSPDEMVVYSSVSCAGGNMTPSLARGQLWCVSTKNHWCLVCHYISFPSHFRSTSEPYHP